MKKSLISLAIAVGMAASGAVLAAGDATVYGNVHVSIDDRDTSPAPGAPADELDMNSNTSSLGVKGTEDLGDGMKALYLIEFQIDPTVTTTTIDSRDQWVGIKGGMGTVKLGTMSSNYKQMGGKTDPMYRTQLEGRGFLMIQSGLHSGSGIDRGRSTDTIQYASPKMGGMQMILNTTLEGVSSPVKETNGLGFRMAGKRWNAYFDFISVFTLAPPTAPGTAAKAPASESAMKVGGKYKAGPVTIGAQFESTEDLLGQDYIFMSANYRVNKNNAVMLTVGQASDDISTTVDDGHTGIALMYDHKLGKMTNIYVGYGDRSDDGVGAQGESNTTFGVRKKF